MWSRESAEKTVTPSRRNATSYQSVAARNRVEVRRELAPVLVEPVVVLLQAKDGLLGLGVREQLRKRGAPRPRGVRAR
jgi:hypothetical protein